MFYRMRLTFQAIFIVSLFGLNTVASAAWVKFAENDRLIAYYDPAISTIGGNLVTWVLFDYKSVQESQRSGIQYTSQKGQQEVDCIGEKSRTVFFTWHKDRMGGGAVVYTGSKPLPWEPNSPTSIVRAISSAVCFRK